MNNLGYIWIFIFFVLMFPILALFHKIFIIKTKKNINKQIKNVEYSLILIFPNYLFISFYDRIRERIKYDAKIILINSTHNLHIKVKI